jgi:Fe2+ or Zn2+ uptake regulation protein
MVRKIKTTTTTTLVLDALRRADDFLTAKQLCERTARSTGQVAAALHWLRKAHAIDSIASDDTLYWYARPREDDTRSSVRDEITADVIKRPRKPKIKKVLP